MKGRILRFHYYTLIGHDPFGFGLLTSSPLQFGQILNMFVVQSSQNVHS